MEFLYGSKVRQDSGVEQAIKAITQEALSTPQMRRLRTVLSKRIDELRAKAEKNENYRKIVTSAKQRRDVLKKDADRLVDSLKQSIDVFIENAKKLTRDTRVPSQKDD